MKTKSWRFPRGFTSDEGGPESKNTWKPLLGGHLLLLSITFAPLSLSRCINNKRFTSHRAQTVCVRGHFLMTSLFWNPSCRLLRARYINPVQTPTEAAGMQTRAPASTRSLPRQDSPWTNKRTPPLLASPLRPGQKAGRGNLQQSPAACTHHDGAVAKLGWERFMH